MELTPEEKAGCIFANQKLALAITPYFFNLIDRDNPNCPIRKQVIPRAGEAVVSEEEMLDSLSEDEHSPVPGLVHRYPDRVLFLVTDRCAAYCRYCTRSRLVSNAQDYNFHPEYEQGLRYIEAHPEVRDVLLSGGDPLLLSDKKLEHLLSRLRAIKHVEFIRIGSRIPVFLRAADHAGALRDFQEIRSDLDEHSHEPSEGVHGGVEGRVRTPVVRRGAVGQPECAAQGRE